MTNSVISENRERALWIAAVQQAIADIADQPLGSVHYDDAAAFFVGGGDWAQSRAAIAGFVDLHPDDLERCGRRFIAARRVEEGLPPEAIAVKAPEVSLTIRPRLEAIPAPSSVPAVRAIREKRDRNWWIAKFMASRAA